MKNYYKLLLVFFIFCSLAASARPVSGVYLTYDDFKNGNLLMADENDLTYQPNSHKIVMKYQGKKKTTYAAHDIWGYLDNGELYRIIMHSGVPLSCKLYKGGVFFIWSYIGNSNNIMNDAGISFVTYGIGGEPYQLTNQKELERAVAAHKEFKPVLECANEPHKGSSYADSELECLEHQPGLVEDRESLIPPFKK